MTITSADVFTALFGIPSFIGNFWFCNAAMMFKTCLGSIFLKKKEFGGEDFKEYLNDFLALGILLASFSPIEQKC